MNVNLIYFEMNTPWQSHTSTMFPALTENIEVDVCIAGGGISGITTAYLLQQSGFKVALLERNHLASGTSGHTTGHITSLIDQYYHKISDHFSEDKARLLFKGTCEARGILEEIISTHSLDIPWNKVPAWYFATDEEQHRKLKKEKEVLDSMGVKLLHDLPSDFPVKSMDSFGLPEQIIMDVPAYIHALALLLVEWGVKIYENTAVEDFTSEDEQVRIECKGVEVLASKFVQCTHTPLKINPIQMEMPHFNSYVICGEVNTPISDGMYFDMADPYHYIRPLRSGSSKWIVGGFDIKTGTGNQDNEQMDKLKSWSAANLGIQKITHSWSNMFFNPADNLPFIGEDPVHKNCYLATGFSGDGLTFGLLGASVNSGLILGESHPLESLLKPARFHFSSTPEVMKKSVETVKHLVLDRFQLDGIELDEIRPGKGKILNINGKRIGIHIDEDHNLYAVDPVCPHMGCILKWNDFARSWDCGCHGSRFTKSGEVISGPALKGLKQLEVEEE